VPLLDLINRERLPQSVIDELEQHNASLIGYLYAEHNDDGTHSDISVDTLTIRPDGTLEFARPSDGADDRKAIFRRASFGVVMDDGALGDADTVAPLYLRGGAVIHNQLVLTSNGVTTPVLLALGDISATGAAEIGGDVETTGGRFVEAGHVDGVGYWTDVAHAGGNFTASTGSWTVDGADQVTLAYTRVGKTMTVVFSIQNTDVSATPTTLEIAVPGGATSAAEARNPVQMSDAGTFGFGLARVTAGGTKILLYPGAGAVAPWTATSSDNTAVFGQITFEVQ
jgi:hypothetical protein